MASTHLSRLGAALGRAAADLDDLGAHWALIGGLAVSARSEPRFTRDVDVAVAVAGDEEAEKLVHGLLGRGYRVIAVLEQVATARLATAAAKIAERGFHRARDVAADLERALVELSDGA